MCTNHHSLFSVKIISDEVFPTLAALIAVRDEEKDRISRA
jgi:hypothetical protein